MKYKALSIISANCFLIGAIYFYAKIKNIEFDWQFYIFIILVVSVLVLVNSEEVLTLKFKRIVYTFSLISIGAVSFIVANKSFILLDKLFRINQNIYYALQTLGIEPIKYLSYNFILEPIFIFIIGYCIFAVLIKVIINIISLFKYYEYNSIYLFFDNNIKIIMAYMTVILVIFGFLPTFVLLVELEKQIKIDELKEVMKLFNINIMASFFVTIVPYAYLIIYDSKNK